MIEYRTEFDTCQRLVGLVRMILKAGCLTNRYQEYVERQIVTSILKESSIMEE